MVISAENARSVFRGLGSGRARYHRDCDGHCLRGMMGRCVRARDISRCARKSRLVVKAR